MGQRKYPPLEPREIEQLINARGFAFHHAKGDHKYYIRMVSGTKTMTQIDWGVEVYDTYLIKKVISQTTLTRKQLYASTKKTAKKINVKPASKEELENWA